MSQNYIELINLEKASDTSAGRLLMYNTDGSMYYVESNIVDKINNLKPGASNLDELKDVILTGLNNGDVLTYENGKWLNKKPEASGGASYLRDLKDVYLNSTGSLEDTYVLSWQHYNNIAQSIKLTKYAVGLSNVDNTADIDKPISTAQQEAIDKAAKNLTYHENNTRNPHKVTKDQVGLDKVDNTSDIDKPVSRPMLTALNDKVNKEFGKGLSTYDFDQYYKDILDNLTPGGGGSGNPIENNLFTPLECKGITVNGIINIVDKAYPEASTIPVGDIKFTSSGFSISKKGHTPLIMDKGCLTIGNIYSSTNNTTILTNGVGVFNDVRVARSANTPNELDLFDVLIQKIAVLETKVANLEQQLK